MVHIDDVIAAALLVAEKPEAAGHTYIVADNEPFSTRQLFEWVCVAVGRRVPRWTMPLWSIRLLARMGDGIGRVRGRRFQFDSDALKKLTGSAWYSSAKLQRELGWSPTHTLRESLREICAAARKSAGR
jgi:nucleoside-diphosphate-sugar epimerase